MIWKNKNKLNKSTVHDNQKTKKVFPKPSSLVIITYRRQMLRPSCWSQSSCWRRWAWLELRWKNGFRIRSRKRWRSWRRWGSRRFIRWRRASLSRSRRKVSSSNGQQEEESHTRNLQANHWAERESMPRRRKTVFKLAKSCLKLRVQKIKSKSIHLK